jgi:hypothetical protein
MRILSGERFCRIFWLNDLHLSQRPQSSLRALVIPLLGDRRARGFLLKIFIE